MTAAQLDMDVLDLPGYADEPDGASRLTRMLREDGAHFGGLSVERAEWLRGHIYAAIALSARPETCLAEAREDLRTSSNPQVLSGVARVIRAVDVPREWRTDLTDALDRIALVDEYPNFCFDPEPSPCCGRRSTVQELEATISGMADTASTRPEVEREEVALSLGKGSDAILSARSEDQDGQSCTLADLITAKPVVLAFFYTRCMNPLKCSLTITRLARCARAETELAYIGMSYDPEFDTPHRLRTYGTDRQMPFSEHVRLARSDTHWDEFKQALQLRTGYGASTVNSHAREVFLISQDSELWRLPPDFLLDSSKITDLLGSATPSTNGRSTLVR